ncbi:hypothetical protein ACF09H_12715 [Streptomyces sp. NPDC014983]|uniref:hypothetical protein n=1 Tax=Streptomyces sp. NPDC014983 TaxID=3364933 RepID=UPI0036FF18C7
MTENETARALALLRHSGGAMPTLGLPLTDMEQAATAAGLRVHLVDDPVSGSLAVLGWSGGEPAASTESPRLPRNRLNPKEVVTFVAAYALLTQRQQLSVIPLADVVALLRACTDKNAHTWAVPALERALPQAGLLRLQPDRTVRLGPGASTLDPSTQAALNSAAVRLRRHRAYPHKGDESHSAPPVPTPEITTAKASWYENDAVDCVRALEAADAPLPARDWQQFEEPATRREAERLLAGIGRTLIEATAVSDSGRREVTGYISGWHPVVTPVLKAPLGGLTATNLAALALVYLYDRLIPESGGAPERRTIESRLRDHKGPDGRDCLKGRDIAEALSRLKALGLIDSRNRIQESLLQRLTPEQDQRLRENVLMLADPGSLVADELRRRRTNEAGAAA